MAAEVVSLPVPDRLCGDCIHGSLSDRGVYCHVFGEWLWSEKEAQDCDAFERGM